MMIMKLLKEKRESRIPLKLLYHISYMSTTSDGFDGIHLIINPEFWRPDDYEIVKRETAKKEKSLSHLKKV